MPVLSRHAVSDLLNGIGWFDRISTGLGDRFETEFYAALNRVKDNPQHFAADHHGFRPCRLQRFNAVLYFRLDGERIVVMGLFVSGQDASVLQDRT